MKPMLLTSTETIPKGKDWLYETKYDGFRCILVWEKNSITLISRNRNELTDQFPEVIQFCHRIADRISNYLPLTMDGELVYLINSFNSEFSIVQTRGRMRNKKTIQKELNQHPCDYIAFDLLRIKGNDITSQPLLERKKQLRKLFKEIGMGHLKEIEVFNHAEPLWNKVQANNGEGITAKKKSSIWLEGERSNQWLKVKNWKYITVVLTTYNQENGFFHGAVYRDEKLVEITVFRHGFTEETLSTLIPFVQTNGTKVSHTVWELSPSICLDIACIGFDGKKLREPRFHAYNFQIQVDDVDWRTMQKQLFPLPLTVQTTHLDKPIFPAINIAKDDYLFYLQQVSPYFLPFLKDRLLTAIRFPHGLLGEGFYQKNAPDYTPGYIQTYHDDENDYILCNDIESLIWLGNQIVLEFHIPFQTIHTKKPTEIVFDLDPPSVNEFPLAIEAALRMKAIFDHFELQSFVKTSGGKGLQVYIPLPFDIFSYEETRHFTEFVCRFLCEQEPQWFTMERLKKNRQNRLYLDYVQHAAGKTIIAPYSPRGNEQGLVATPLNWSEVTESLRPNQFSIPAVIERMQQKIDPFKDFRLVGEKQQFVSVLNQLKGIITQ